MPRQITRIRVTRSYESCQRTTFWVELTTDEGYSITPDSFATGSIYTNFEGLDIEEARDRALTMAWDWADLLEIQPEPYVEEGVTYEPLMAMETYTTRRIIGD